jgi:hypothetical protein
MFRKGFASLIVTAAATAVLWSGGAQAQVRTASLQNGGPALAAATNENRIALVIGNSQYQANKALTNPANDAQAVSQVLNTAGFEVVMAFDLARDIMRQTVEEFAARVNDKGPNTVVLIYYAGHGLQVDGENYLVPVDAKLTGEDDLPEQGIKLAEIMGALEAVSSKARIVILDACRNNPFTGEAGGRGLAIVDAPTGSIVAYSTAPGTEAFDGNGRHSPYAAAFMRTVKTPNLPIEQVFKRVRLLVNESTEAKQTPWESSSLTSDFVFFANAPAGAAAVIPQVVPAKIPVAELSARPVRVAYETVIAEDSVDYYEEFVRLYPTDPLCDHVRRLLNRRKQMIAWQNVTHANSPDAYASFASRFGNIDLGRRARRLQEKPRPIQISFPRRGEGRFGDGRFGGGIKIGNGGIRFENGRRPVIDFGRGNTNGGRFGNANANGNGLQNGNGRNPVIPFPRNGNNLNGQNGRVVGLPNGNTGINGNRNSDNVNGRGQAIPFPRNGQGNNNAGNQNGRNASRVTLPNGNTGINPNAGRLPNRLQNVDRLQRGGIDRASQIQRVNRVQQFDRGQQFQRQNVQFQRQNFQPRASNNGGQRFGGGNANFGGRRR